MQQERGTISRPKRFFVSTPILIGTAIGAASLATAGVTAAVIAKQETNRIVVEEQAHRVEDVDNALHNNWVNMNLTAEIARYIDKIRQTEAWSSHASNTLSHSEASNDEINHLLSRSSILEFSDPATEVWYTAVEDINSRNSVGLTESEIKEKTRLSADLTTMITTVVPITNSSQKCEDKLLVKSMLVPLVNHRSRMEVTMENGRLIQKYDSKSTYILLSQDAVLSKKTKMFGQDIHMIGRICRIHSSVNATSSSSADALFEDFSFQFEGNLTLIETCPLNGTHTSFNWTFVSQAKIRLPIICSIRSDKINCDSVRLQSGHTKELHLSHYRMQIVEQKLEEEKININKTIFVKSDIFSTTNITPSTPSIWNMLKLPLIGTGAAVILVILLTSAVLLVKNRSSGGVSVSITNAATSSSESPVCTGAVSNQANPIILPSAPEEIQEEEAQFQDAPPDYYSTLDINAILAVKPEDRNPFERRAANQHSRKLKENLPTPNQV